MWKLGQRGGRADTHDSYSVRVFFFLSLLRKTLGHRTNILPTYKEQIPNRSKNGADCFRK